MPPITFDELISDVSARRAQRQRLAQQGAWPAPPDTFDPQQQQTWHDIGFEAYTQGIDPRLALAATHAEGTTRAGTPGFGYFRQQVGGRPVTSPVGATGVMQVMPETAADYDLDPAEYYDNIAAGVRKLKQVHSLYPNDPHLAFASYNAGEGSVKQAGGIPQNTETPGYVRRAMTFLQSLVTPASADAAEPHARLAAPMSMDDLEALYHQGKAATAPVTTPVSMDDLAALYQQGKAATAPPLVPGVARGEWDDDLLSAADAEAQAEAETRASAATSGQGPLPPGAKNLEALPQPPSMAQPRAATAAERAAIRANRRFGWHPAQRSHGALPDVQFEEKGLPEDQWGTISDAGIPGARTGKTGIATPPQAPQVPMPVVAGQATTADQAIQIPGVAGAFSSPQLTPEVMDFTGRALGEGVRRAGQIALNEIGNVFQRLDELKRTLRPDAPPEDMRASWVPALRTLEAAVRVNPSILASNDTFADHLFRAIGTTGGLLPKYAVEMALGGLIVGPAIWATLSTDPEKGPLAAAVNGAREGLLFGVLKWARTLPLAQRIPFISTLFGAGTVLSGGSIEDSFIQAMIGAGLAIPGATPGRSVLTQLRGLGSLFTPPPVAPPGGPATPPEASPPAAPPGGRGTPSEATPPGTWRPGDPFGTPAMLRGARIPQELAQPIMQRGLELAQQGRPVRAIAEVFEEEFGLRTNQAARAAAHINQAYHAALETQTMPTQGVPPAPVISLVGRPPRVESETPAPSVRTPVVEPAGFPEYPAGEGALGTLQVGEETMHPALAWDLARRLESAHDNTLATISRQATPEQMQVAQIVAREHAQRGQEYQSAFDAWGHTHPTEAAFIRANPGGRTEADIPPFTPTQATGRLQMFTRQLADLQQRLEAAPDETTLAAYQQAAQPLLNGIRELEAFLAEPPPVSPPASPPAVPATETSPASETTVVAPPSGLPPSSPTPPAGPPQTPAAGLPPAPPADTSGGMPLVAVPPLAPQSTAETRLAPAQLADIQSTLEGLGGDPDRVRAIMAQLATEPLVTTNAGRDRALQLYMTPPGTTIPAPPPPLMPQGTPPAGPSDVRPPPPPLLPGDIMAQRGTPFTTEQRARFAIEHGGASSLDTHEVVELAPGLWVGRAKAGVSPAPPTLSGLAPGVTQVEPSHKVGIQGNAAPPAEPQVAQWPAQSVSADEPPIPPGMVRLYHGGDPTHTGKRWFGPDRAYAEGYATKSSGGEVFFLDLPAESPLLEKSYDDTGTSMLAPPVSFEGDVELSQRARSLGRPPATPAAPAEPPTLLAPPETAPAEEPSSTAAPTAPPAALAQGTTADPRYLDVLGMVRQGQTSIAAFQRRLKIGYTRAVQLRDLAQQQIDAEQTHGPATSSVEPQTVPTPPASAPPTIAPARPTGTPPTLETPVPVTPGLPTAEELTARPSGRPPVLPTPGPPIDFGVEARARIEAFPGHWRAAVTAPAGVSYPMTPEQAWAFAQDAFAIGRTPATVRGDLEEMGFQTDAARTIADLGYQGRILGVTTEAIAAPLHPPTIAPPQETTPLPASEAPSPPAGRSPTLGQTKDAWMRERGLAVGDTVVGTSYGGTAVTGTIIQHRGNLVVRKDNGQLVPLFTTRMQWQKAETPATIPVLPATPPPPAVVDEAILQGRGLAVGDKVYHVTPDWTRHEGTVIQTPDGQLAVRGTTGYEGPLYQTPQGHTFWKKAESALPPQLAQPSVIPASPAPAFHHGDHVLYHDPQDGVMYHGVVKTPAGWTPGGLVSVQVSRYQHVQADPVTLTRDSASTWQPAASGDRSPVTTPGVAPPAAPPTLPPPVTPTATTPSAADTFAQMDPAALDALFDDILAEQPTTSRQATTPLPPMGERPTAPPPQIQPEADGPSAASIRPEALEAIRRILRQAQGEVEEPSAGYGTWLPGVDPPTYTALHSHFAQALEDVTRAGGTVGDFLRILAREFGAPVRPYLHQFHAEMQPVVPEERSAYERPERIPTGRTDIPGEPRPADTGALEDAPPPSLPSSPGAGDAGRGGEAVGTEPGGAPPGADVTPAPDVSRGVGTPPGGGVSPGGRRRPRSRQRPRVTRANGKPGSDYRIATPEELLPGGPKDRYRRNVEAIRLLKTLEAESRLATAAEQHILAKYAGWGALPQVFDQNNARDWAPPDWKREYAELRELLSDAEYTAARASTPNAHFTSYEVIEAMYQAARRFGFQTGRILEPSMGVGNFFGVMPRAMREGSILTGIELDSLTARIAKQLYQSADIRHSGFQDALLADNFFDLAVSNVPFGSYSVHDPRYNRYRFPIHTYFFAKALDKVRAGGIVAFITSTYTLDSATTAQREYLAKHADLAGAIRLPRGTFDRVAGTEVATDILFLRKKGADLPAPRGGFPVFNALAMLPGTDIEVNEYFAAHPEMMLGTMERAGTMYRRGDPVLVPHEGQDIAQALAAAVGTLPRNIMPPRETREQATTQRLLDAFEVGESHLRENAFTVRDGKVFQREGTRFVERVLPTTTTARVIGIVGIRDAARDVLARQFQNASDDDIQVAMQRLNTAYDTFVTQHGAFTGPGTANRLAFRGDPDYPLLLSLEDYSPDTETATKTDIFSKRTVLRVERPMTADSPQDALMASLAYEGRLNWFYMMQLTGQSAEELQSALEGLAYDNPNGGGWETADQYLSGDVRTKLDDARAAAQSEPRFATHIAALEAVQPATIPITTVNLRMGDNFVPAAIYQQFLADILETEGVSVVYNAPLATWSVFARTATVANTTIWGVENVTGADVAEAVMNFRQPKIWETDESGNKVVNQEATLALRQKMLRLRERFQDWIFEHPEVATALEEGYNQERNRHVERRFNGQHLTLPGLSPAIIPRPHQLDAVWRGVQDGTALFAHAVGAGKTFVMTATAMELRRLGLANKPLFLVPNHLINQWPSEMLRYYPGARILPATRYDLDSVNRQRFFGRIVTGNWDAVILPYSSFGFIPVSDEFFNAMLQEQIDILTGFIAEYTEEQGKQSTTVKQLEATKKRLEAKLRGKRKEERQHKLLTWEELGVDALFVDELHNFKNLYFPTKMERITGLGGGEAGRAFDLYAKITYLRHLNNGRGVYGATGTPISNTLAEAYTMMRYFQPDLLKSLGVEHFDAWANAFADTITRVEVTPTGKGFAPRTSFSQFRNMPELRTLMQQAVDIKTASMLNLPKPAIAGGAPRVVTVPSSPELKVYVDTLLARAKSLPRDRRIDNMLKITSDGRHAALDIRLVLPDALEPAETKAKAVAATVSQIWRDTAEQRATQLVFLDLGTPKKAAAKDKATGEDTSSPPADELTTDEMRLQESIYHDLRQKLIATGIPAHEIAFIHDAKSDAKRIQLFRHVREGAVRVLMGSTGKMGEGMNVQDRLIALHHMDVPWKPSEIEQREGRILRPGNQHSEVQIYRYITQESFDAYMWQTNERKQRAFGMFLDGTSTARTMEDLGDARLNSFAEATAAASGNPLVLQKHQIEMEMANLGAVRREAQRQRFEAQRELGRLPARIQSYTANADQLETIVLAAQSAQTANTFTMQLGRTTYTDPEQAGIKLLDVATTMAASPVETPSRDLGTYYGARISGSNDGPRKNADGSSVPGTSRFAISAHGWATWIDITAQEPEPVATVQRFTQHLLNLPDYIARTREDVVATEKQLADLRVLLAQPLPYTEELAALQQRYADILTATQEQEPQAPTAQELLGDEDVTGEGEEPPSTVEEEGTPYAATPTIAEPSAPYGEPAPAAVAPVFFSQALRVLDELLPERTTPGQVRQVLKRAAGRGVKQEELKWLGLEEWLQRQPHNITKQDVMDWLRSQEVQVKWTVLGEPRQPPVIQWHHEQRMVYNLGYGVPSPIDTDVYTAFDANTGERIGNITAHPARGFVAYSPALQNADFPTLEAAQQAMQARGVPASPLRTRHAGGALVLPGAAPGSDREVVFMLPEGSPGAPPQMFTTDRTHYGDFPNVTAWLRMNDRTGPQGEKLLHIEEVQSKWQMEGREKGFARTALPGAWQLQQNIPPHMGTTLIPWAVRDEAGNIIATGQTREEATARALEWHNRSVTIPPAPFVTTAYWYQPALKWAIHYAASHGYAGITWTTGAQQQERYDLRKVVDELVFVRHPDPQPGDNIGSLYTYKDGKEVHSIDIDSEQHLAQAIGKDNATTLLAQPVNRSLTELPPDVTAHIMPSGEWVVEKAGWGNVAAGGSREEAISHALVILNESHAHDNSQRLTGDQFEYGGEWAEALYDRTLPNWLNKYVQANKWGTKSETTAIRGESQHWRYDGPESTLAEVTALAQQAGSGGPDRMLSPVTGNRLHFAFNRASMAQTLRSVQFAMQEGATFPEAMAGSGSQEVAEIFGGTLGPETVTMAVHTLPITDPMRHQVVTQGQQLFEPGAFYAERPDATPQTRQLARDALADLDAVATGDISTLRGGVVHAGRQTAGQPGAAGTTILYRRLPSNAYLDALRQTGRAVLVGQKAPTVHALAILAQATRDPRIERLHYVYTRGEDILAVDVVSSRLPSTSAAFFTPHGPQSDSRAFAAIRFRMERLGADGFFEYHNHPSTKTAPSAADIALTIKTAHVVDAHLPALAAQRPPVAYIRGVPGFRGHLVINHDEYSVIDAEGQVTTYHRNNVGPDPFIPDLTMREAIHNDHDIVRLAKGIDAGNQIVGFFRDHAGYIRGIVMIPPALLTQTIAPEHNRTTPFEDWLRGQQRSFGAQELFLYQAPLSPDVARAAEYWHAKGLVFDMVTPTSSLRADLPILYGITARKTSPMGYRVAEEPPLLPEPPIDLDAWAEEQTDPRRSPVASIHSFWAHTLGNQRGGFDLAPLVDGFREAVETNIGTRPQLYALYDQAPAFYRTAVQAIAARDAAMVTAQQERDALLRILGGDQTRLALFVKGLLADQRAALEATPATAASVAAGSLPTLPAAELHDMQTSPDFQAALTYYITFIQGEMEALAPQALINTRRRGPIFGTYIHLHEVSRERGVHALVYDATGVHQHVRVTGRSAPTGTGGRSTGSIPWALSRRRARAARPATGAGQMYSGDMLDLLQTMYVDRYATAFHNRLAIAVRNMAVPPSRTSGIVPSEVEFPPGSGHMVPVVRASVGLKGPGAPLDSRIAVPRPIERAWKLATLPSDPDEIALFTAFNNFMTGAAILMPAEAVQHILNVVGALITMPGMGQSLGLPGRAMAWSPLRMAAVMADIFTLSGPKFEADLRMLAAHGGLRARQFGNAGEGMPPKTGALAVGGIGAGIGAVVGGPAGAVTGLVVGAGLGAVGRPLKRLTFDYPTTAHRSLWGMEARGRVALLRAIRHMHNGISDVDAAREVNNAMGTYVAPMQPTMVKLIRNFPLLGPFGAAAVGIGKTATKAFFGFAPGHRRRRGRGAWGGAGGGAGGGGRPPSDRTGGFSFETLVAFWVLPAVTWLLLNYWLDPKHRDPRDIPGLAPGDVRVSTSTGETVDLPLRLYAPGTQRGLTLMGIRAAARAYTHGQTSLGNLAKAALFQQVNNLLGVVGFFPSLVFTGLTGAARYLDRMSPVTFRSLEPPSMDFDIVRRLRAMLHSAIPSGGEIDALLGDLFDEADQNPARIGAGLTRLLWYLGEAMGFRPTVRGSEDELGTAGVRGRFGQYSQVIQSLAWRASRIQDHDVRQQFIDNEVARESFTPRERREAKARVLREMVRHQKSVVRSKAQSLQY